MQSESSTKATLHGSQTMTRVWRFKDAPKQYRNLSGHGGDEDWVIVGRYGEVDDIAQCLAVCDYSLDAIEEGDGEVHVAITSHA